MQMQHVQDQCIVRACKGHRHALAAAPTTRVEPQNKIRTGRWRRLMARRPNRRLASLLSHRDTRWLPRNLFIPSPLSTIMASTRPHSVPISAARIKFRTPGVICTSTLLLAALLAHRIQPSSARRWRLHGAATNSPLSVIVPSLCRPFKRAASCHCCELMTGHLLAAGFCASDRAPQER
jgi:hypothetical protein